MERAAQAAGVTSGKLLCEFGVATAQTTFHDLFPEYYESSGGTRPFLLGIEEKIHELVRATVPYAYPPRLRVKPLGEGGVMITYTSERMMCELLEGLVRGTAAYYGEAFAIDEIQCMRRGDELGCVFTIEPA